MKILWFFIPHFVSECLSVFCNAKSVYLFIIT